MSKQRKLEPPVDPKFIVNDPGRTLNHPDKPLVIAPPPEVVKEKPPQTEKKKEDAKKQEPIYNGLAVPSAEELEAALFGNALLAKLGPFRAYVDIDRAYSEGKASAAKEASVAYSRESGDITSLKRLSNNCKDSARASLRAIVVCAQYVAQNKNPGGLADAIKETSFLYNLALEFDEKIKRLTKDKGPEREKEDPEKAAERYFKDQELKHRGYKEARKTQMTWIMTLLDDSEREMKRGENSEWDRKFWSKVYQLAMGIRDEVRKEAAESSNIDLRTYHLSGWWLLVPIGIAAGIYFAVKYFT